jgi:hypothetical protein
MNRETRREAGSALSYETTVTFYLPDMPGYCEAGIPASVDDGMAEMSRMRMGC